MIRRWLTSATGLALCTLIAIMLIVLQFDKSAYTQEEIDWCAAERPLMPFACEPKEGDKIEVHFKEFEEDG